MDAVPGPEAILASYPQSLIKYKVRQLSTQRGFVRSEEEDLRQELTIRALAVLHRFDPNRAGFNTFIARVVESAAAMIVRERRRLKRGGGTRPVSLEAEAHGPEGQPSTLRQRLTPLDAGRRLGLVPAVPIPTDALDEAIDGLPEDLKPLCHELMSGTPYSAARRLGRSRRQIANDIARIRPHLEQAGFGDP
ncbi:MAG: hypothetical protein L6R00_19150 [Phycisphaerae bacterium]|nr:hypothetical protein [Phycisphaerae bacterium]